MVLFFPDNTVLVNFATVDRIRLLEGLANGKGRWTSAVASECARSSRVDGLGALADVEGIFGPPIMPTPAEMVDSQTIRTDLARPGDSPTAHLGEAETVAVISRRAVREAVFVSDDRDALTLATGYGIRIADTWELLGLATRVGLLSEAGQAALEAELARRGRRRPRRG